ncbi:MAG: RNA polymerase factor sigma-54, partial [Variovorax sp.]
MKQGLSLRVSQHLALTPQLQQSIRLLQLSTLELSQEVEQMLDENPFLERTLEEAAREEFGVDAADAPARRDDGDGDGDGDDFAGSGADAQADAFLDGAAATASAAPATTSSSEGDAPGADASDSTAAADAQPDWEGDGTVEMAPDDSEWGGDAPARNTSSSDDGERADAAELARSQESLPAFLHRQALSLRLGENDRAALAFLIESLNDDGYLEDSLPALASGLAGEDNDEFDGLVHHFQVALGLLQSLEPAGVGARDLGECLTIQLRALERPGESEAVAQVRRTAIAVCRQPMELLARRDFKRLATLVRSNEEAVRAALQLVATLEPKPGRRFVDVERNIVVPDVIVTRTGRGTNIKFRVALNPDVMPRLRVHDIYAGALKQHKGEGSQALSQRLQEARWFIKNI